MKGAVQFNAAVIIIAFLSVRHRYLTAKICVCTTATGFAIIHKLTIRSPDSLQVRRA